MALDHGVLFRQIVLAAKHVVLMIMIVHELSLLDMHRGFFLPLVKYVCDA